MADPLIPYIQAPEIPLSFLTRVPHSLVGAAIGALAGSLAGTTLAGPAWRRPARIAAILAAVVVGALVGYAWSPEIFDPASPPSIKPFGVLVALGVYIGSIVAVRHARERGLDEKAMSQFIFWVVGAGFVGGHVFDDIFYHPQRVLREPLHLLALWDGLSSFGGFIGALSGAIAFRVLREKRILPYCEVVNSAFPLAWVFGRAGCASVHDHPGNVSDAWFAVRYPFGDGTIGRYDLGLYECVLSIPLAVAFLILWHRRPVRPLGFYTGIMCVAYAPVRFGLDFLREGGTVSGGDPRYAGLTPAQWACFGLLAVGLYFVRMAWLDRGTPAPDPGAAPDVAAGAAPPPEG